jgi:hypothetical protein
MNNEDKQAAMPFSPQESLPELEEQALEKITGGGSRQTEGKFLKEGANPFRNWERVGANSRPDLDKFATTSTGVPAGPITKSQQDTIATIDSQQQATLTSITTPKSIAERRQIVNDFRELPFHS